LKKPAIDLLGNAEANWISISIQPSNSISIELQTKQPGLELTARTITMATADTAKAELKIDAYEAMILNATLGDRSLFLRSDEVNAAWKAVDPILAKWSQDKTKVASYTPGSWPTEDSTIFDDPSHEWRNDF
jgi:glucose-6-phosphate 1-dehydrogenase